MKIEYREVEVGSPMQIGHLVHFIINNRKDTLPSELDHLRLSLPEASGADMFHIYVAVTGISSDAAKVVGCAMLSAHESLFGRQWWVENVLVAKNLRGQGIGTGLMKYVAGQAKGHYIASLRLTSNPKRVEANGLYQKLGWTPYDTNVYELYL